MTLLRILHTNCVRCNHRITADERVYHYTTHLFYKTNSLPQELLHIKVISSEYVIKND